ncbi:hypothetical protein PGR10_06325 [Klebsiella sp. 141198]|uniref:hypothetical protein n=1 Tax=Klebsiella sp. 141198 TaxID=3020036 RepID=UPI003D33F041
MISQQYEEHLRQYEISVKSVVQMCLHEQLLDIKNKIEDLQNVSDIVDTEQAVNQLKTQYNKIDTTYMLFVNENTNEEARAALQKYMYGNEE